MRGRVISVDDPNRVGRVTVKFIPGPGIRWAYPDVGQPKAGLHEEVSLKSTNGVLTYRSIEDRDAPIEGVS